MKISDLQHTFSATETLSDELWHWPWLGTKCENKRSVTVSVCHYSETHKETIRNLDSQNFIFSLFKKKPKRGLQQKSPTSALSHTQKISIQGHYSGNYKKVWSGLQTYQSKCKKFNFFCFIKCILVILY